MRRLAVDLRQRIARVDPVVWVALAVGLCLRAWRFGDLPPGLNQDEASMAYDAYCLGHFGIDRHGYPLPVMLVSWGSGMYALASYLTLPFVRVLGLSVFAARLPFLLVGLAALPLFYALLLHTTDRRTARIGIVLLAISPWHVMVSRWALDSNLLPFVFLLATVLLVRSTERPRFLIVAAACYALALYAYGTAYLVVPVFAVLVLAHGLRQRCWPRATLLASAGVFAVTALPVALYVAINNLGWRALTTPVLSIPRLTGVARYQTMGNLNLLSAEFLRKAGANFADAGRLFWQQDDGLIWNAIPGCGLLFPLSTFLALAGLALLVEKHLRRSGQRAFPLLAWCLAAVVLMAFVSPNINRLNIAMLPFIYCVAVALSALWHHRAIVGMVGVVFAGSLVGFVANYFGPYRAAAADPFFASFGEAIRHAAQTEGEVCVTGQVNMPYIFVLFYNREHPRQFARTVHIDNPGAEFQSVSAFGRYRFGLDRCAEAAPVIVATHGEAERFPADRFTTQRFERFTVLTRRP